MIDLTTFFTKTRVVTNNWNDVQLYATDFHTKKVVCVACNTYATGALGDYPHATKERAERNIEKLQKYLIDSKISTEYEWTTKADNDKKFGFSNCFSSERPYFSHE